MFTSSISGPFSEWNTKVPRIKSPKGLLLLGCFLSRFLCLLPLFLSHLVSYVTPSVAQNNFPPLFLCTPGSLFCKPYLVKYSQSFLVFKKLNKFFCNILPLPKHTMQFVQSPPLKTYLSPRRSRSSLIPSNSVFKSRSFSCSTSTWLSYWGWVLIWKDVIWPSWQAITETGLCQHLWLIIKIYPCYFTKWIPVNIQLNLVKSKGSTMESK